MDHDLAPREASPVHVTDSLVASEITENECPAIDFETVIVKCENDSVSPSYQYLESEDFAEEHSFTESNQNNFPEITQFLCETVINTDDSIEGSVDDLSTSTSIHVVKNNCFIEKEVHNPGHNALLPDIQSRFGYHLERNNYFALKSQDSSVCALEDGDMLGMQFKMYKPGMSYKNITLNQRNIDKGMNFDLMNHMNHRYLKHSPKRKYECNYCGNIYSTGENLKRHVLSLHHGYKPFKCAMCNKEFATNSCLKRHLNSHSGYRAYKCVVCEKAFKQRIHLKIHMTTHTEMKIFVCAICEKNFSVKQGFISHMKSHGKN